MKSDIKYVTLPQSTICQSHAETIFVQLKCGATVGVVYRPPSSNMNDFITSMEKIIVPLICSEDPIIVCGDFNIDLLKQNCSDYMYLLESKKMSFLFPRVLQTTPNLLLIASWVILSLVYQQVSTMLPLQITTPRFSSYLENTCPLCVIHGIEDLLV